MLTRTFVALFVLVSLKVTHVSNETMTLLEATEIATETLSAFYEMFKQCVTATTVVQQFLTDDMHNFLNYPSRTTIGYAPKFTNNRKFFANLISTKAFKEMLAKDVEDLRKGLIKKIRFCDEAVMDQKHLRDFYDREVDKTKF